MGRDSTSDYQSLIKERLKNLKTSKRYPYDPENLTEEAVESVTDRSVREVRDKWKAKIKIQDDMLGAPDPEPDPPAADPETMRERATRYKNNAKARYEHTKERAQAMYASGQSAWTSLKKGVGKAVETAKGLPGKIAAAVRGEKPDIGWS